MAAVMGNVFYHFRACSANRIRCRSRRQEALTEKSKIQNGSEPPDGGYINQFKGRQVTDNSPLRSGKVRVNSIWLAHR